MWIEVTMPNVIECDNPIGHTSRFTIEYLSQFEVRFCHNIIGNSLKKRYAYGSGRWFFYGCGISVATIRLKMRIRM